MSLLKEIRDEVAAIIGDKPETNGLIVDLSVYTFAFSMQEDEHSFTVKELIFRIARILTNAADHHAITDQQMEQLQRYILKKKESVA